MVRDEAKAACHQNVDWTAYFEAIRNQCPWSHRAWLADQIDIQPWQGQVLPLAQWQARIWLWPGDLEHLARVTADLDLADDQATWLYSHAQVGDWGTPVPCMIQQWRQRLEQLQQDLGMTA